MVSRSFRADTDKDKDKAATAVLFSRGKKRIPTEIAAAAIG